MYPDSNPDPKPDPELIRDPDPKLQIIPDPDAQHWRITAGGAGGYNFGRKGEGGLQISDENTDFCSTVCKIRLKVDPFLYLLILSHNPEDC